MREIFKPQLEDFHILLKGDRFFVDDKIALSNLIPKLIMWSAREENFSMWHIGGWWEKMLVDDVPVATRKMVESRSKCCQKELVEADKVGQWVSYCPICKATHVSHNEGLVWSMLKDIQPDHPNPFYKPK